MRRKTITIKAKESSPTFLTLVVSVLVTMLLGMGFTFMLTSTYEIEIYMPFVALAILFLAIGSTLLHTRKSNIPSLIGRIISPILSALLIFLDIGSSGAGFNDFLLTLKRFSFRAMPLDLKLQDAEALAFTSLFIILCIVPVMFTTWVVAKKKNVFIALIFYVPYFVCSVALNYMFPSQIWCEIAFAGVIVLCFFQNIRKGDKKKTDKKTLILVIPALLLVFGVGLLYPQKTYDYEDVANDQVQFFSSLIKSLHLEKTAQDMAKAPVVKKVGNALGDTYMGRAMKDSIGKSVASVTPDSESFKLVGDFDPPDFEVFRITRSKNPDYVEKDDGTWYLYLKSTSMDVYSPEKWARSDDEPKASDIYGEDFVYPTSDARYILEVEAEMTSEVIMVPNYTDHFEFSGMNAARDYNVLLRTKNTGGLSSYWLPVNDIPCKLEDAWSEDYLEYVNNTALQVPDSTRENVLASGVLPQWFFDVYYGNMEMSDMEKVRAVTEFVSGLHPYDEATSFPPDGADFVVWFMTESETGFCVHYATTAVILLRMLGVPARYVSGYMADYIHDDEPMSIRSKDAHAWFEYFDPDYGWIMGDPTPGNETAASAFCVDHIMDVYGITKQPLPDNRNIPSVTPAPSTRTPTPSSSSSTTPAPSSSSTTPTGSVTQPDGKTTPVPSGKDPKSGSDGGNGIGANIEKVFLAIGKILKKLLPLFVLILFALLLRFLYIRFWKRGFHSEEVKERASAYYRYFNMVLKKYGARPGRRMTILAQKAAFSEEGISEEELNTMIKRGTERIERLRKNQPWYKRLLVKNLLEVSTEEEKWDK